MVERLEWMDEVACIKKAQSLPLSDPVREVQLLDAMETLAVRSDLPAEPVRKFFTGQVVAAKMRQEECLRGTLCSRQGLLSVPDLTKTIRPALDLIGKRMISALVRARDLNEPLQVIGAARLRLEKEGYSKSVMVPAIEGLEAGLSMK